MFDRLKEDIKIVFDRDPAARSSFEILMTYPGIHALIFHRFSHRLWKLNCYFLARLTSHFARFMTGIEIHPGAVLGRRLFIDHGMGVVIGETAIIGDDCTLYHGVTLGGTSWQKGKRHPTLGSCVVVGAGAQVLGPIEISNNVRIGSNSVVVRAVPEGATVVGIPGRVVNEKATKPSPQQEAMAKRIGFDAYGTSVDIPDPVAVAINSMLDHIQVMDKEMEKMCQEIKALGGKINEGVIEEMSPQPFDDGTGRSCLGGSAVGK